MSDQNKNPISYIEADGLTFTEIKELYPTLKANSKKGIIEEAVAAGLVLAEEETTEKIDPKALKLAGLIFEAKPDLKVLYAVGMDIFYKMADCVAHQERTGDSSDIHKINKK